MPLKKKATDKAFTDNLKTLLREGKPTKQALAISYDIKRRAKKK